MGMNKSLPQLSKYIEDNVRQIEGVRSEMAEVQVGFNSKYVEWKANHDAALERLVETVLDRMDAVGPALRDRIEERVAAEQRIIAERRQELRETLIPQAQEEGDAVLEEGRSITEMMRAENPRLNEREEKLKARQAKLEAELADLNAQVRQLSGCLGVVVNFFKITKLDRQRQQVIGQLTHVHETLTEVREEWREIRAAMASEEDELQARWQELTQQVAQLQGELNYLDQEANRETLALKRAARHVLDDLKEPIPCPVAEIEAGLDEMVKMNVQTDDYQEGLGAVSSLMSLLVGVSEGLKRFNASVEGLIDQQRMHSAHLSMLDVAVPDSMEAFNAQWESLAQKVRDDGRLCENPAEFLAAVRPVMEQDLSEERIQEAFESLGEALSAATARWK